MHVSWRKQAVVPPFITGTWRANTAARVVIWLIIDDSNNMRCTIIILLVTIFVIEGLRMLDSSWVFKFRRLSLSIVLACSRNLNFFSFSFVPVGCAVLHCIVLAENCACFLRSFVYLAIVFLLILYHLAKVL